MLGEAVELGRRFEEVMKYFKGHRTDIGDRPMLCNLPPTIQSRFIHVSNDDPFISKYALFEGNIGLLTIGKYEQRDIASTCYHEKLKPLMGMLHHTLDGDDDVIVVDNIAGTDNIATSLSFAYDLNVFVVEPTQKSVKVYNDYVELVPQYADRLFVVGNKISDPDDEQFLRQNIPQGVYLGSIPLSRYLKDFEQGDTGAIEGFGAEQAPTFKRVYKTLRSRKRDWPRYIELLRAAYDWDCQRWYSDFYGCDLATGIDRSFSYEQVLNKQLATSPA